MSQHFFGKCFFIISRIFFQGSDAHSASWEPGTSLSPPEVSRERSSDHKQHTRWIGIACVPAGPPLQADTLSRLPSQAHHEHSNWKMCLGRSKGSAGMSSDSPTHSARFLGLVDTFPHPGDREGHENAAGIISDALGQWMAQKTRWRVKN